jgi:hypothetical protein
MSHGFTISDIRRYVEGKMSATEMHLVEKAALEDPFLADAIEGMQYAQANYGNVKIDSDIADLKKNLAGARHKSRSIMGATWWSAAAAIFIIVTAVTVIYFFNGPRAERTVTVAKVEQFKKDTPALAPALAEKEKEDSAIIQKNDATVAGKAKRQAPVAKTKKFQYEVQRKTIDSSHATLEQQASTNVQVNTAKADTTRQSVASALEGRAAGIAITQKSKKKEPDAHLEEVVVVGYGANKKIEDSTVQSKRITPAGGWKSFDEYIASNKRIDGADSLITGDEEVTFNIDEAGLPFDFKIIRSLSEAHDKEAIRLLKEGPTWSVEKGRRKLRLKIKF